MSVRKRTWTILGGGLALALTVTAASADDSANYMLPGCRAYADRKPPYDRLFEQGLCAGVLRGIGFMGGSTMETVDGRVVRVPILEWCLDIPDAVTLRQMAKVVVAYIDARPAQMHEDFRLLALNALRTAWPCK
jgi:hypothetical protein